MPKTQFREMENPYYQQHFIEIAQIKNDQQLFYLLELTEKLSHLRTEHSKELTDLLRGFTVAVMFYQASTRTYGSFVSAAGGLGANVIAVQDMTYSSSVSKGENLEDSSMTAANSWLADILVQRHPNDESSEISVAKLDTHSSNTRVINAGSGKKEHPTQALLDANTIFNRFGRLDNLHVAMVGDMANGRTVKSLSGLLATVGQGNKLTFVSPDELRMPPENIQALLGKVELSEFESFEDCADADVYYWTRVQREWFTDKNIYEKVKDRFILTPELAATFSPHAIFMHPLPRLNEISEAIDTDPRAVYLEEQMASGPHTRMALIAAILLENPFIALEKLGHIK